MGSPSEKGSPPHSLVKVGVRSRTELPSSSPRPQNEAGVPSPALPLCGAVLALTSEGAPLASSDAAFALAANFFLWRPTGPHSSVCLSSSAFRSEVLAESYTFLGGACEGGRGQEEKAGTRGQAQEDALAGPPAGPSALETRQQDHPKEKGKDRERGFGTAVLGGWGED